MFFWSSLILAKLNIWISLWILPFLTWSLFSCWLNTPHFTRYSFLHVTFVNSTHSIIHEDGINHCFTYCVCFLFLVNVFLSRVRYIATQVIFFIINLEYSISKVTEYRLDRILISDRGCHCVRISSGTYSFSYSLEMGGSFPMGRTAIMWKWLLICIQYWGYIPYFFMAWCYAQGQFFKFVTCNCLWFLYSFQNCSCHEVGSLIGELFFLWGDFHGLLSLSAV